MSHFAIDESVAICARAPENGLIRAECAALTGGVPDADGVAPCTSTELIERAAYVQTGLRTIASASTFDELVGHVGAASFDADRFRIDVHDPASRLGISSQQAATALANAIDFGPDLRDPQRRFLVIATNDQFRFASVETTNDSMFRRHESKPWTTSSSLDPRFSRALVNLVPDARSILDPCCGAGSIVLEAASLGLDAIGVDWKPAMVGMTRENLKAFDYDAIAELADSRTMSHTADAIVTDLPYGHAIKSDEATVRAILGQGASLARLGVYVAPHQISSWLTDAGYVDVAVHTVMKRRGFTRWIHVATSELAPTTSPR